MDASLIAWKFRCLVVTPGSRIYRVWLHFSKPGKIPTPDEMRCCPEIDASLSAKISFALPSDLLCVVPAESKTTVKAWLKGHAGTGQIEVEDHCQPARILVARSVPMLHGLILCSFKLLVKLLTMKIAAIHSVNGNIPWGRIIRQRTYCQRIDLPIVKPGSDNQRDFIRRRGLIR